MNFSMNFKKYVTILSMMFFVVASGAPYVDAAYASIECPGAVSSHDNKGVYYGANGYDKDGYDREGFDKDGYDRRGYDKNGVDCRGFKEDGINVHTGTRYNEDGYDINGYDRYGNFLTSGHHGPKRKTRF